MSAENKSAATTWQGDAAPEQTRHQSVDCADEALTAQAVHRTESPKRCAPENDQALVRMVADIGELRSKMSRERRLRALASKAKTQGLFLEWRGDGTSAQATLTCGGASRTISAYYLGLVEFVVNAVLSDSVHVDAVALAAELK